MAILPRKTGTRQSLAQGLKQVVGVEDGDKEDTSTPSPGITAPSGSAYSSGDASAGSVKSVTPPQTKGSGFTNIQKILKATGTESGAGRLAQKAAGGVRQAARGAQEALTSAVGEFGKGKASAEQELQTRAGSFEPILQRAVATTSTTPTDSSQQQQDVQSWKLATSGAYSGPTGLGMTPEQQRKAAQSSALSKLAGDTSGRSALLQKYVGSPQYGESKQRLDALLLGRGGASQIRSALREGARAEQELKRQDIVAQEQAKQLQQRATGIAEEAKSAFGRKKSEVLSEIDAVKAAEIEKTKGAFERISKAVSDPSITSISRADLTTLGLTESDISALRAAVAKGYNPNEFLTERAKNKNIAFSKTVDELAASLGGLSKEQFATSTQKAQLGALGQLAGESNLGLSNLGEAYTLEDVPELNISQLSEDAASNLMGTYFDPNTISYINRGALFSFGSPSEFVEGRFKNNLKDYISGKIKKEDFISADPIYKHAKEALTGIYGTPSTVESGGILGTAPIPGISESQRDQMAMYYNNILSAREQALNNFINSMQFTKEFQYTD